MTDAVVPPDEDEAEDEAEVLDDAERARLPRRVRIALAALATVAVAVAVVVALRQDDGGDRRAGPPTPALTLPTGNYRTTVAVSPCGEGSDGATCRVSIGVPHAVIVALRAAFPYGTVDASSSVSDGRGRLYTRRISVVSTGVQVNIHVGAAPRAHATTYGVATHRRVTTTTLDTEVFGSGGRRFLLEIEVVDRHRGAGVPRAQLERLAHDPRLLATR